MTENKYVGNCHCGNISFTFTSKMDETDFIPRTCSCSFCRRHAASYISDPVGKLNIEIGNIDGVSFYQFGHKTCEFIICKKCGVDMMAISDIEDKKYAVINIRTMLNHNFSGTEVNTLFDGETIKERLARRAQNWIAQVKINS